MMELMQGYAKEDGVVGIDDLSRWPYDSDAVQFLSMTTFETKTSKFQNVRRPIPSWPYICLTCSSTRYCGALGAPAGSRVLFLLSICGQAEDTKCPSRIERQDAQLTTNVFGIVRSCGPDN